MKTHTFKRQTLNAALKSSYWRDAMGRPTTAFRAALYMYDPKDELDGDVLTVIETEEPETGYPEYCADHTGEVVQVSDWAGDGFDPDRPDNRGGIVAQRERNMRIARDVLVRVADRPDALYVMRATLKRLHADASALGRYLRETECDHWEIPWGLDVGPSAARIAYSRVFGVKQGFFV